MKIIDNKGKLFGKVNIFDLIIIVIIAAALIFAGLKIFGGSGDGASDTNKTITYKVKVENVAAELYDEISKHLPDQLMAGSSMVNAHVVEAEKADADLIELKNAGSSENVFAMVGDSGLIDIVFTIEAEISASSVLTQVGSQEVRLGKSHIVKTVYTELTGTIISVEGR